MRQACRDHKNFRRGSITADLIAVSQDDRITTTASSQCTTNKNVTCTSSLALFSLQWTSEDATFSKPGRDLWKWKDATLGDGRDYFVPKPKTLRAMQDYLLQHTGLECSVLSNCARFDILCVIQDDDQNRIEEVAMHLSRCLVALLQPIKETPYSFWKTIVKRTTQQNQKLLDWPEMVLNLDVDPNQQQGRHEEEFVQNLASQWRVDTEEASIVRYMCLVAGGMAIRPKRPDRPPIFRPFSSRDAHILLQLKRTKELCSHSCPLLQRVWDVALRAGKGVRTTKRVPELKTLQDYGTGDSMKYSSEPPTEVWQPIALIAQEKIINQLVDEFIMERNLLRKNTNDNNSNGNSALDILLAFRQGAEALAHNSDERSLVRKRLHRPTMALRARQAVDVDRTLLEIEQELETMRGDASETVQQAVSVN